MGKISFLEEYLSEEMISELMRDIPKVKHKPFINFLRKAYNRELRNPPKIALIGRTGVGKSSTLNALFGTRLMIRHTRPATRTPTKIQVNRKGQQIKGKNGNLVFYDMPGVGEDIDIDEKYIKIYQDTLTDCDVVVWVIEDDDRDLAYDQMFIKSFKDNDGLGLASRLVIGINKVDRIHPGNWNNKFNLPSKEQEHYIYARKAYVQEKLGKISLGLSDDRIVAYSAKFHYRLTELFGAMLKASPSNRAWVLDDIKAIGSFLDGVDKEILKDPKVKELINQHFGAQHATIR